MHKLQSIQMYLKQASWGISQFFWLPQEYSDKMAAVLLGVNILHQPPYVFLQNSWDTSD